MKEESNREIIKKKEELLISTLLLHQLGYEPDDKMSSEEPDIIIPSKDDGNIGVEVTKYLNETDSACYNNFQKILEEYAVRFDEKKKTDIRYNSHISYRIRVFLHGGFAPKIIDCRQKKQQIVEEIDNFLFPHGEFNNDYVESVEIDSAPNLSHTKVSICYIGVYEDIDEGLLFSRIKDKDKKLRRYKQLVKNKNLKEYYLLIFIPELHQIDIKSYKLPNVFETDYNRIYLTRGADCCQIK